MLSDAGGMTMTSSSLGCLLFGACGLGVGCVGGICGSYTFGGGTGAIIFLIRAVIAFAIISPPSFVR